MEVCLVSVSLLVFHVWACVESAGNHLIRCDPSGVRTAKVTFRNFMGSNPRVPMLCCIPLSSLVAGLLNAHLLERRLNSDSPFINKLSLKGQHTRTQNIGGIEGKNEEKQEVHSETKATAEGHPQKGTGY
jgi:hypothetical protein